MSDLPFGFSNRDDDPDRQAVDEPSGSGANNPFGFGFGGLPGGGPAGAAGGFDPAALGQMLTPFGQMFCGGWASRRAVRPGQLRPGPQLARPPGSPRRTPRRPSTSRRSADAVHLAEVWLDGATTLPAGAARRSPGRPGSGSRRPCRPGSSCAPRSPSRSRGLGGRPARRGQGRGRPAAGDDGLDGRHGVRFAARSGLAQLATEVLTSTDVGLPLGPGRHGRAAAAARSPSSARASTAARSEVRLYLATREAAHHRLYADVPWLRDRLLALIEDYARGHPVDFSAVEQLRGHRPDRADRPGRASRQLLRPGHVRAARPPPSSRPRWNAGDAAGAGRGLGGDRGRPTRSATGCPAPRRFARRCAAAAPPAGRPSRPSPRWSAWNCGRARLREAAALWRAADRTGRASTPATRSGQHPDLLPVSGGPRRSGRLHRPRHRRRYQRAGHRRGDRGIPEGRVRGGRAIPTGLWIADRGGTAGVPQSLSWAGSMRSTRRCRCCCDPTAPSRWAGIPGAPCWCAHPTGWPPRRWPRCCAACRSRRGIDELHRRAADHGLHDAAATRRPAGELVAAGVVRDRTRAARASRGCRSGCTAAARCRICWSRRCAAPGPGSPTAATPRRRLRLRRRPGGAVRLPGRRSAAGARPARRAVCRTCRCGSATAPGWSARWSSPA